MYVPAEPAVRVGILFSNPLAALQSAPTDWNEKRKEERAMDVLIKAYHDSHMKELEKEAARERLASSFIQRDPGRPRFWRLLLPSARVTSAQARSAAGKHRIRQVPQM